MPFLNLSKFTKDGLKLLSFNLFSRLIGFFGTTYAAKCLGPYNLGVSGLVHTSVTQASLLYDGGLNIIGIRDTSAKSENRNEIITTIISFRALISLFISFAAVLAISFGLGLHENDKLAWYCGVFLFFINSLNLNFAYQANEKLPLLSSITFIGVVFSSLTYLIYFNPGMTAGSDLVVICFSNILTTSLSWWFYRRQFGELPLGLVSFNLLKKILLKSKTFWITNAVGSAYPALQIYIITLFVGLNGTGIFRSALIVVGAVELVFSSFSTLFLPRMINWRSEKGDLFLWNNTIKLSALIFLICFPLCVVAILGAPIIFPIVFGPNFNEAILIFQIILIGKIPVFVGAPFYYGIIALAIDRIFLIISVSIALLSSILNFYFVKSFGLIGAAFIQLTIELLQCILFFLIMKKHCNR